VICGVCGHALELEARGPGWRRWGCTGCDAEFEIGDVTELHCWQTGPRLGSMAHGNWIDDCGTTCTLEAQHEGPHAFERDDEIVITILERAVRAGGAA
jgi:hypothetical protein